MAAEHLRAFDAATATAGAYTEGVSRVVDAEGRIRVLSTAAIKGSAIDQTAIGSADDWLFPTLPQVTALGYAEDRTGAAYTVLVEDIGRRVIVDAAITLPVLGAAFELASIDIYNESGADLTPTLATNVTLTGASVIGDGEVGTLLLRSDDGTNATWRLD